MTCLQSSSAMFKQTQAKSFDKFAASILTNWWWTSELSDIELKQLIYDQISKSIELKEACGELGIPYVDVSPHFEESLDRAEAILNTK